MPVVLLMLAMIAAPFLLWWSGDTKAAGFVGVYVFLSIPSFIQVCWVAYKDKAWPRIIGGPSVSFGRRRYGIGFNRKNDK